MDISSFADTLVLGRTLRQFVKKNKFDKGLVEKGVLGWMPSKVGHAFTLGLT